jgi:hypothetical protein
VPPRPYRCSPTVLGSGGGQVSEVNITYLIRRFRYLANSLKTPFSLLEGMTFTPWRGGNKCTLEAHGPRRRDLDDAHA